MLYLLANCHWHNFLTKGFQVEGLRVWSRQGCHFSFVTCFQPPTPILSCSSWIHLLQLFLLIFLSQRCHAVLWVYLFFACCVFYLLFGFTFLYKQSCIVSLIVLLRPTIGINTCFISDYKLYSYNERYEEMWPLLCAVFFRKSFMATFLFRGSYELRSLQMPP